MQYDRGEWLFVVTATRITCENRRQRVYLAPKEHYWKKHYNYVRALIELGEIRTYEDLVHYCRGKIDIIYTHRQPGQVDVHLAPVSL